MGAHWFRVGELGCGMLAKTLNNTFAATSVLVTRRVLADAHAERMDEQQLLEVLNASSGSTWFSKNIVVIDWANEDYAIDSTIGILEKDVRCAMASLSRQPVFTGRALFINIIAVCSHANGCPKPQTSYR